MWNIYCNIYSWFREAREGTAGWSPQFLYFRVSNCCKTLQYRSIGSRMYKCGDGGGWGHNYSYRGPGVMNIAEGGPAK